MAYRKVGRGNKAAGEPVCALHELDAVELYSLRFGPREKLTVIALAMIAGVFRRDALARFHNVVCACDAMWWLVTRGAQVHAAAACAGSQGTTLRPALTVPTSRSAMCAGAVSPKAMMLNLLRLLLLRLLLLQLLRMHPPRGQVLSLGYMIRARTPGGVLAGGACFMFANLLFFVLGAAKAKHDGDGLPAPIKPGLAKFVLTTDGVRMLEDAATALHGLQAVLHSDAPWGCALSSLAAL